MINDLRYCGIVFYAFLISKPIGSVKKMKKRSVTLAVWSLLAIMGGCVEEDISCSDPMCAAENYISTQAPLTAYCSIVVKNFGTVDMETDYIPNVTCCENGGAPDQALRAQAVAARSVAYHNLKGGTGTAGNPIGDSQAVQVYSCGGRADSRLPMCKAAATDTSGMVLRYKDTTLCAFYVSGSKVACLDAECKDKGDTGASCYASQQKYVTYNEGKTGTNVTQSTQGWVNQGNYANRGTMSQNGATCLDSNRGYNWVKIVKFFYGADIEIVKTTGSCVQAAATIPGESSGTEVKCETVLDKSGVVIDDKDACFSRSSVSSWYELAKGHGGHLFYTFGWDDDAEAIGKWTINVTRPGKYEVFAYIDSSAVSGLGTMSAKAPYVIRASGVEHHVTMDLSQKNGWVSLGQYAFSNGGDQWVKLHDSTGEKYDANAKKVLLFDAIKFEDVVTCTHSCQTKDGLECSGNGFRKCGDFNGDGCLEWSEVTACGAEQQCVNGACQNKEKPVECTDDCSTVGEQACVSEGGYRVCGSFDADSCLDWSEVMSCQPGEKCVDGACVVDTDISCEQECLEGETICEGDKSYRVCGFFDEDACREFSEPRACDSGEVCRYGACVPESGSSGTKACVLEIDGRESTIIDELDPCFERSNVIWSQLSTYGYDDHLFYANANATETAHAIGTWHLNVTKAGKYTVWAYVESGIGNVVDKAQYTVMASGKAEKSIVTNTDKSGWVKLGDYDFEVGKAQYVKLSDDSFVGNASLSEGRRFVFDAIKVAPYDASLSDDDGDDNGHGDASVSVADGDCAAAPRQAVPQNGLATAVFGLLGFGFAAVRRRRFQRQNRLR